MMAAGTPPDLFYLPPDLMPELASLKLIRPIDDYLNKDIASGNGAIHQGLLPNAPGHVPLRRRDESRRHRRRSTHCRKDFTTLIFYVNKELFQAAGVPIPYNGWTWDEFEADMARITALNGRPEFAGRKIYGGDFELWADTLRDVLWTFGGDFFGKSFRDVTLDSPRSQQALDMIVRTRLHR